MRHRYSIIWILITCVALNVISLVISVQSARRGTERAVEVSEESNCALLQLQIEVYRETPPTTATGVELQRAYENRYAVVCTKG